MRPPLGSSQVTDPRPSFRLTQAQANKLRYRLTRYFRAYYKTLRREIEKAIESGTDPDSVPHYYKGHKKVQTILCRDGVMVVHFPADEGEGRDRFEFYAPRPRPTVKDVAAGYNLLLPGGGTMDPLIDYVPGDHFGPWVYSEPRQMGTPLDGEGGEVIVEDEWHRLDMVSWSRVGRTSTRKARSAKRGRSSPPTTGGGALKPGASWKPPPKRRAGRLRQSTACQL